MADHEASQRKEPFPLLPVITGVFVCVLVLTPSASSKFIALGDFGVLGNVNIVGSTLFFPISYLFGDVLTEVYGYEKSRRIIWIGFAAQMFAAAMYALIQILPAASFWKNQDAYDAILGQAPRIVVGSLTAYFFGEFINSFIVSKLKFLAKGKAGIAMAVRFIASTIVAEFLDSMIFLTVAFSGTMANHDLIHTIISIWAIKTLYEVVALPVTLPLVQWIKRREGIDHVDAPETTSYMPFKL